MLKIGFSVESCKSFIEYLENHRIKDVFKSVETSSYRGDGHTLYTAVSKDAVIFLEIESRGTNIHGLSADPEGGVSGDYSSKGDLLKALRQLKVDESQMVALKNLKASTIEQLSEKIISEGDMDVEELNATTKKPKGRFIDLEHKDLRIQVEPVINRGFRDSVSLGFKLHIWEKEVDSRAQIVEDMLTKKEFRLLHGKIEWIPDNK
jgi:hypothetical protein